MTTKTYPKSGSPEYWECLKARRPVRAPRWNVGDLVYCPLHRRNMAVVGVQWDDRSAFTAPAWETWVPGHGGTDLTFSYPRADVPTVVYRRRGQSNCWEPVYSIPPLVKK